MSLVQLSCRRYQPRRGVQGPALGGCWEEVGVPHGGRREGAVPWVRGGLAGWAVEVWRVYVDVFVVLGGRGWSGRYRVVSLVRGGWSHGVTGACGAGVLWWAFFRGALVVSSRPVDGHRGRVWGVE